MQNHWISLVVDLNYLSGYLEKLWTKQEMLSRFCNPRLQQAPFPSLLPFTCQVSAFVLPAAPRISAFSKMSSTWTGAGVSQDELMLKDECILVDEKDNITGHANKHSCHRFVPQQPRGQLHRAFSVFLFDESNRLLLQQRAKDKITFPSVWTNTCCSHPLYGQKPEEVDTPEQVANATVPGIKHAAVRKLQHELGIPPEQLPLSSFRFLTRLHYCAADTHTWGSQAEWGEHEVDYVLFVRAPVTLKPNTEEVDAVRYVTPKELQEMMHPTSGLLWSPWFRIIAEKWLQVWWADLEGVLNGKHQDLRTIHHIL